MSSEAGDAFARLQLLQELATRYRLTALLAPLEACRTLAAGRDLTVAVFGRFKAGKSTLLNRVVGRDVLPVGALPVTAVITALAHGPREEARVDYLDGHSDEIALDAVAQFVTESQNPGNVRGAAWVSVQLPTMAEFAGLRLIDTPGLDSAFEHNTRATREWLPRVDVALVAVPADSPLGATDLALITDLRAYTPKLSLALTKYDLLSPAEQPQVLEFVQKQLQARFGDEVEVLPYSAREGYEALRLRAHRDLLLQHAHEREQARCELLAYKTCHIAASCEDYLRIGLRSAQAREAEREELRDRLAIERDSLQELHATLRLIANDAGARLRTAIGNALAPHAEEIRRRLAADLAQRSPGWRKSLALTITGFSSWLQAAMGQELSRISLRHRLEFRALVAGAERRLVTAVQDFENRIADRAARVLDLKLRAVEVAIETREPEVPDVNVGRVFDHAWELLSWAVPMSVFGGQIESHLVRRLPWEVAKHLSRLTSQWEESVRAAITIAQRAAGAAAEDFVSTLEALLLTPGTQTEGLEHDLSRLRGLFGQPKGD